MIKLDTDSSVYRSVASFLDPGASLAPGRKRKVPLFALARISASACIFASDDHHATHGIRVHWSIPMRGIYLSVDALLRTLNCLTDLGFFDATFQSLEHAMSCAVELDVGLPRPLDQISSLLPRPPLWLPVGREAMHRDWVIFVWTPSKVRGHRLMPLFTYVRALGCITLIVFCNHVRSPNQLMPPPCVI
jgi:hypothetical protein